MYGDVEMYRCIDVCLAWSKSQLKKQYVLMNNIVNLIKLTFVKMYVIDKFIHDVKNGSECCHTIIERELKKPRFYD